MAFIILSIVLNIIPTVVLPLLYHVIPDSIPAFVDFLGHPIVLMEKSYLSIFRLTVMGILLSMLCIVMYNIKLEHKKLNQIIWRTIACITSLKMGITSLEVLFFENTETVKYFRLAVFILVIVGIIILLGALIKMYKDKYVFTEYKKDLQKNKILLSGILLVYIITALMPFYIQ